MRSDNEAQRSRGSHRWTHFGQHLRIFVYVMLVLVLIDVVDGTDAFFVQWVAAIWGAILALHLFDNLVFGGRLIGFRGWHGCWEPQSGQTAGSDPTPGSARREL